MVARIGASVFSGLFDDRSVRSLILANGITIALALILRWELGPLMWVYWAQSVTIGIFQFR